MRLRTLTAAFAALCLLAAPSHARTARDLSARMHIDGYTNDFITGDEDMFGIDPRSGLLQESLNDSPWQNNEITQLRITWDEQYLYIAGEGIIWGNNMMLLLDTVPGRGLADMTNLNSWRRNFTFDQFGRYAGDEFLPDIFGATWDTNLFPHLLTQISGNQVDDHIVGPEFKSSASFSNGNTGRAMEFAIPWRNVFAALSNQTGSGTRDTVVNLGGSVDTLRRMPLGVHSIKIAAVLTGGWDGSGGPDVAPDNLRGTSNDGNANVLVDNYARIDLDLNDDTGMGQGGPDGIPDWDVSPITRVHFRYPPPVSPLRFFLKELSFDRPVFRPDMNENIHFHVALKPDLNPQDPLDQARTVTLSASVYDIKSRWIRNLFLKRNLPALTVNQQLDASDQNVWDGRDASGNKVPAGVYIIRTTLDQNLDRATHAVVVVR